MTKSRFLIASLLLHFGVGRKSKRLTEAAYEMHLMQDGEELLGAFCWKNLENIEDVASEYWNIRRLEKRRLELIEKMKEAEQVLLEAQLERTQGVTQARGDEQPLLTQRTELLASLEDLANARDDLMTRAKQTKRKHSALKTKIQVLKEEGGDSQSEILASREQLAALREDFTAEKEELMELEQRIQALKAERDDLQDRINSSQQSDKEVGAKAFSKISDANRKMADYKAELGTLTEAQAKLFREVGRFLNKNSRRRDCKIACKDYNGILQQVGLLYKSVTLNRKLVVKMGG